MENLKEELKERPVICAVRNMEALPYALKSPSAAIIFLTGDLFQLQDAVKEARAKEKFTMVHTEMIAGIKQDRPGIRYLARCLNIQGIITTRRNVIQYGREEGLLTIQRLFMLDSAALKTGMEIVQRSKPHMVEVLPAIAAPYFAGDLIENMELPLIAGGLIRSKNDIDRIIASGILGVSTSLQELWLYPD